MNCSIRKVASLAVKVAQGNSKEGWSEWDAGADLREKGAE